MELLIFTNLNGLLHLCWLSYKSHTSAESVNSLCSASPEISSGTHTCRDFPALHFKVTEEKHHIRLDLGLDATPH